MARIRSVHPGLFTDESFIQLSDAAQIFFVGLWTEADDQGVFEWKPATLKLRLRGASTMPVEPLLAELEAVDCIRKYQVSGRCYGAIRNFQKFQRPKKPNKTHILPSEFRTYVASEAISSEPDVAKEPSGSPPEDVEPPEVPKKSEIPPQMEDGGGRRKEGKKESSPAQADGLLGPDDIPPKRGSRLPPDWQPSDRDRLYATNRGIDPDLAAEEFRSYWLARAGKEAVKLNWSLTFQNRVLELQERGRFPLRNRETATAETWGRF